MASMEPCLFRHGKATSSGRHPAACMLQWSHVFSDMVRWPRPDLPGAPGSEHASMEPCLFRHGKSPRAAPARTGKPSLQWSHVFSDMVRSVKILSTFDSSNWLQWSHVFSDMVRRFFRQIRGSQNALQWSHVFSDMVRKISIDKASIVNGFNGAMSFQTW